MKPFDNNYADMARRVGEPFTRNVPIIKLNTIVLHDLQQIIYDHG
jgi:hypothetical protein